MPNALQNETRPCWTQEDWMQPVRQRLLRVDSILFHMRANDLEAVVKRQGNGVWQTVSENRIHRRDHTKIRKQRIDNSVKTMAYAVRRTMRLISGGTPRRTGAPTVPRPRFT